MTQSLEAIATVAAYLTKQNDSNEFKAGNIIDLGSGAGKAVFGLALLQKYGKIIGIEESKSLFDYSTEILKKYNSDIEGIIKAEEEKNNNLFGEIRKAEIEFINNDFLKVKWDLENYNYFLCYSTSFTLSLMRKVSIKAGRELKVGSYFISFSKTMVNPCIKWGDRSEEETKKDMERFLKWEDLWESLGGFKVKMDWGIATAYVYKKKKAFNPDDFK